VGSAGQLARSFRRLGGPRRRNEQRKLSTGTAWTIAVVTIVSRSALSTIVALLLWSILPNFVGFQTTTVMSGSMMPRLQVGDAVITHRVDAGKLSRGQVLLFDDPDHIGQLRMHRLMEVRADGELVTKGDANEDRDSTTVGLDALHGTAFLRIPYAGLPNYWMKTGNSAALVGSGVLVILLVCGVRLGRLLEDPEERTRRRHRGVRLPGAHRAAAATLVLLVLSSGAIVPPAEANAAYNAKTVNGSNRWATMCGDVSPTGLGTAPRFYWGYGSSTGANIADLSPSGVAGSLVGDAVRAGCADGFSPSLSVGTGSGGFVVEQPASPRSYPGDLTIATWFKTSSAGGTLADFGNSKTGASTNVDKVLFMRTNGNLTFGSTTLSLLTLSLGSMTCTTTSTTGYADGNWHLAVATYSDSAGCTITVDNGTAVSTPPSLTLTALTGFTGYWRFGGDQVTWSGSTSRQYFIGNLDESQVYGSVLDATARSAIFTRRH
jgi:signal peptidase I